MFTVISEKNGKIRIERLFDDNKTVVTRLVKPSLAAALPLPNLWVGENVIVTQIGAVSEWDKLSDNITCEVSGVTADEFADIVNESAAQDVVLIKAWEETKKTEALVDKVFASVE